MQPSCVIEQKKLVFGLKISSIFDRFGSCFIFKLASIFPALYIFLIFPKTFLEIYQVFCLNELFCDSTGFLAEKRDRSYERWKLPHSSWLGWILLSHNLRYLRVWSEDRVRLQSNQFVWNYVMLRNFSFGRSVPFLVGAFCRKTQTIVVIFLRTTK